MTTILNGRGALDTSLIIRTVAHRRAAPLLHGRLCLPAPLQEPGHPRPPPGARLRLGQVSGKEAHYDADASMYMTVKLYNHFHI